MFVPDHIQREGNRAVGKFKVFAARGGGVENQEATLVDPGGPYLLKLRGNLSLEIQ